MLIRIVIFLLLLAASAGAGSDLVFNTAVVVNLPTNDITNYGISLQMHKIGISLTDTTRGWLVMRSNGGAITNWFIFVTTNTGTSWTKDDEFWCGDHANVAVANDSVMVVSGSTAATKIAWYTGVTKRSDQTLAFLADGTATIGLFNPSDSKAWVIPRINSATYSPHHNIKGLFSTNSGANWDSSLWVDSLNAITTRDGVFAFIGGHPCVGELIRVTNDQTGYFKYRYYNGSVFTVNNDSMVVASGSDICIDKRAYTWNGFCDATRGDTAMFLFWNRADYYICKWKHYNGGTGTWKTDSVAASPSYALAESGWVTSSVIGGPSNYKLAVFYKRNAADSIFCRVLDPADSTWSDEQSIGGPQGHADWFGAVQNAHARQSMLYVVAEGGATNDTTFSIAFTDTTTAPAGGVYKGCVIVTGSD